MIKKIPIWARWLGLAVLCWAFWSWFFLLPSISARHRFQVERSELETKRLTANRLLATSPELVRVVDSLDTEIQRTIASFCPADELEQLIRELRTAGRRQGVGELSVVPDLASALELPVKPARIHHANLSLDTLIVTFRARARFPSIGTWLDEIESRSDFLQWCSSNWTGDETGGPATFSGAAAFWVSLDGSTEPSTKK